MANYIQKNDLNLQISRVDLIIDFFSDFNDLVILTCSRHLIVIKLNLDIFQKAENKIIELEQDILKINIENEQAKSNLVIFMISNSKMMQEIMITENKDKFIDIRFRDYLELPIEVTNLKVEQMVKLSNLFVFLLSDSSTNQMFLCVIQSDPPFNITSFFLYEFSKDPTQYYFFPCKIQHCLIVSSNNKFIFNLLILDENPKIDIKSDFFDHFDKSLTITASNNFNTKKLVLLEQKSSTKIIPKKILLTILYNIKSYSFVLILISICLLLIFIHYLINTILNYKNLQTQRTLDNY